MFANMNLGVTNTSFPDVTRTPTPGGPVPVPLPNTEFSASHVPSPMNVMFNNNAPAPKSGGTALGGIDPMAWLSMLGGGER